MLGLILGVHPELELVDEDDLRFHTRSNLTYLLDLPGVRRAVAPDGKRFVFKAPRDTHRFEELLSCGRGARILWVVRPVHQVVASMCRLRVEGESWALTHAYREICKYLQANADDQRTAEMCDAILEREDRRRREVELATLCWIVKEKSRSQAQRRHPDSVIVLDYVRLTSDPEAETRLLCSDLGLDWSRSLVAHHAVRKGERIGGTSAERSIDRASQDLWKRELSPTDQGVIEKLLQSSGSGSMEGLR